MEKENKSKVLVIVLAVLVVVLGILCALFATGTISLKNSEINSHSSEDTNQETVFDDKISIDLSIGNVTVSPDGPNNRIFVDGIISLSFDAEKYVNCPFY